MALLRSAQSAGDERCGDDRIDKPARATDPNGHHAGRQRCQHIRRIGAVSNGSSRGIGPARASDIVEPRGPASRDGTAPANVGSATTAGCRIRRGRISPDHGSEPGGVTSCRIFVRGCGDELRAGHELSAVACRGYSDDTGHDLASTCFLALG